jgi:hypothetical protein
MAVVGTERLPLHVSQNPHEAIVTVPLDASTWHRFDSCQPDFAYVYLEFDGYVPVRSARIQWTDGSPSGLRFLSIAIQRFRGSPWGSKRGRASPRLR